MAEALKKAKSIKKKKVAEEKVAESESDVPAEEPVKKTKAAKKQKAVEEKVAESESDVGIQKEPVQKKISKKVKAVKEVVKVSEKAFKPAVISENHDSDAEMAEDVKDVVKEKTVKRKLKKSNEPSLVISSKEAKENAIPGPSFKIGGFLSQVMARKPEPVSSAPTASTGGGLLSGFWKRPKPANGDAPLAANTDVSNLENNTDLIPKIPKQYVDQRRMNLLFGGEPKQ